MRRLAVAHFAVVGTLLACLPAQAPNADQELSGTVVDGEGKPVANADVSFVALPVEARPRVGAKGRYQVAQAAHRSQAKPPRTRTDRHGTWRVLLSPQHAALAGGSGVELALKVSAPGHDTWMRAIGDSYAGARDLVATLPKAPGARLKLSVRGASQGGYRGAVLIERAYRARPDRSVMLRTLLPLPLTGEVEFHEPARVPGEVGALLPTARAEGYRVSVYAAGLRKLQRTLIEGSYTLELEPDPLPARRVLAERGAPARTPIEATWQIGGEDLTLSFAEPTLPLLGGEVPVRARSASGDVTIDAWDPDAALFVEPAETAVAATATPRPAAELSAQASVAVFDRRKNPLYGAAVWLEDAVAREMWPAHKPFAITGVDGQARLANLPKGTHRALVRHPAAGEREVLIDTSAEAPLEVVLREPPATPSSDTSGQASLLVDLSRTGAPGERVEIGVVQTGQRMLRRAFDEHPQRVRLEGLTPGPLTLWAKIDDGPVHVLAGVLATLDEQPPATPLRAIARSFTFDVRSHDGQSVADAWLSLGEASPRGAKPLSASLLPLQPDADGKLRLTLHLSGDLWVVVHGKDGQSRDLLLQSEPPSPTLSVSLPAPNPAQAAPGTGK